MSLKKALEDEGDYRSRARAAECNPRALNSAELFLHPLLAREFSHRRTTRDQSEKEMHASDLPFIPPHLKKKGSTSCS